MRPPAKHGKASIRKMLGQHCQEIVSIGNVFGLLKALSFRAVDDEYGNAVDSRRSGERDDFGLRACG
jgi:hypothetical protein